MILEFSSLEAHVNVVTTVNPEQEHISASSAHLEESTSELRLVSFCYH